ncbi:hypothetical protein M6G53_01865 [Serratia nevei]|nr:hypothetical protein [Serratia nevei]MCP1104143.1 hypothetical protein [Serratia nevei]
MRSIRCSAICRPAAPYSALRMRPPIDIETARHADQANGVEAIGVLQDLGFQPMPAEKLCASIA